MTEPQPPLPRPSPESLPLWEACRQGTLSLQRCSACGRYWVPPSVLCPHCWSRQWGWEPVSGRGTVFSFAVFRRAYHPHPSLAPPYVVAVIELAEGPRLATRLVGARPEDVCCGMAVEVALTEVGEGWVLPLFRPSSVAEQRAAAPGGTP